MPGQTPKVPSITCPVCEMTSHDVPEGYCGNCRDWTGVRRPVYRYPVEIERVKQAFVDFVAVKSDAPG